MTAPTPVVIDNAGINFGDTVILNGKRGVVMDEPTFSRLESAVDELAASRKVIASQKQQTAAGEDLNAKNGAVIAPMQSQAAALKNQAGAESNAAASTGAALTDYKTVDAANQRQLSIYEKDNARLKTQLTGSRRLNLILGLIAAGAIAVAAH